MSKQTAVDWLADEMLERFRWIMDGSDEMEYQTLVDKAKEMEKKQIAEAYYRGEQGVLQKHI